MAPAALRAVLLGLGWGLLCWASPSRAEDANFGSRTLAPGFSAEQAMVNGFTGGSYSLSALSNRDRQGNRCLGYGDSHPDHILTLETRFEQLTLTVDSGGSDTTLIIEGPMGFLCGNDIDELNLDAQVSAVDWEPGDYRIWVGTMASGDRQNYRLSLEEALSP